MSKMLCSNMTIEKYGLRFLNGTLDHHLQLEGTPAKFAGKESAIEQLKHFNLKYVIPGYTDQDSYALRNISRPVPGVHMLQIHPNHKWF